MEKSEIRKDCFGYTPGKKDCQVLTETVCLKGECPFFKTKAQFLDDQKKYSSLAGKRATGSVGFCRKKPVRCIETGVVYPSLRAAAADTHVHVSYVSAVCNGRKKHAGGYRFEFV